MHIEVSDLRKNYGTFSLRVPHLHIGEGETIGLVGNNGAGKTTFLRLLLDLLEADVGTITVDDDSVTNGVDWKTSVGAYLDESFIIDFLTAEEFFDFIGGIYGIPADRLWQAIHDYRPFLGADVLGEEARYLRDLSTGNRKKVGIVAALAVKPDLLILDEPFANLDPGSQIYLKTMLRTLHEHHETTMLISSHDLVHVTDVCTRTVVLHDGTVELDLETSAATLQQLESFFAQQHS